MSTIFFKYPSTPHIISLGVSDLRNDKVLSPEERTEFLKNEITIEEKIDGANLGISFDENGELNLQNRGSYLYPPYTGQWKKVMEWLAPRYDELFEYLTDRYILFGEWCYAQHSVFYTRLPDWFLGFDLYDTQCKKFLSTRRNKKVFQKMNVCPVATIKKGVFTLSEIEGFIGQSLYSEELSEGVYLRYDSDDWMVKRAKLVRPAFMQAIEPHWSRSGLRMNQLDNK